ncbi:MAG: NAD(P)H-hydrate dehydratase [Candidatus Bipolaricaulota bacterium]
MLKVFSAETMRTMDARAAELGVAALVLMESAGRGAAEEIRDWRPELSAKRVLALCGKGGNGGDALSAARWLGLWGADVRAVVLGKPAGAAADEERAFTASFPGKLLSVREVAELDEARAWLAEADLVLDGILGIGLSQGAQGLARAAIEFLADAQVPVVAMDVPSGLLADSGAVPGPAVRAELTLAMGGLKPCHLLPPAAGRCGEVRRVEVAYPPPAWEGTVPLAQVVDAEFCAGLLPPRPRFGHKGTFGRVLVVGGAVGMAGAVALAAEGALRAGAGLVHVLCPAPVFPIVAGLVPEALVHPGPAGRDGAFAPEAAEESLRWAKEADVVVVGPGLGRGTGPAEIVRALVTARANRMVIDADGLYALAQEPKLLTKKHAEIVLTPHPGEFTRLVGREVEEVLADKITLAREAARKYRAVVAVKGPPTTVAAPDGAVVLGTTGNTALAHGGSGDVLAGMIGGLWASGVEGFAAAVAGAYVHGLAAELATVGASERAVLPRDILDALPEAFASLERDA